MSNRLDRSRPPGNDGPAKPVVVFASVHGHAQATVVTGAAALKAGPRKLAGTQREPAE